MCPRIGGRCDHPGSLIRAVEKRGWIACSCRIAEPFEAKTSTIGKQARAAVIPESALAANLCRCQRLQEELLEHACLKPEVSQLHLGRVACRKVAMAEASL